MKDEAKELFDRFDEALKWYDTQQGAFVHQDADRVKKSTLICVDEKIKLLKKLGCQVEFDMVANILLDELQEQEELKTEIEKL